MDKRSRNPIPQKPMQKSLSQENYERLSQAELEKLLTLLDKLISQGADQGRNVNLFLQESILVEIELGERK